MVHRDTAAVCPLHNQAVPLIEGTPSPRDHGRALYERFGPVAPVELEPGVAAWLVLGYNEARDVLGNPGTFGRDPRGWREITEGRLRPDSPLMPVFGYRPNILHSDGAEHQRYRSSVTDALRRIPLPRLLADTRELADQLIDQFIADGHTDVIDRYSRWLPALVMNRAFGMEDRHGYALAEMCQAVFDTNAETALRAGEQIISYVGTLVETKRRAPGEDVVTWMMRHPSELSDEEMGHQIFQMLLGNNDATAHLIANTVLVMLTERKVRFAYARSEDMAEEAVNWVLWNEPTIPVLPARYARTDTMVGGTRIRAGEGLLIGLAAANADPALGYSPEATQDTKVNRAHLSWGAGLHRCPAENVARQVVCAGVARLFKRIPEIQLSVPAESLRWRPSMFLRGLDRLPVEFPPEAPRAAPEPEPVPAPAAPAPKATWLARLGAWLRPKG